MFDNYKKILITTLLINVTVFFYYLANSDINPSNDAFYYLAIADSLHNGTGFVDITTIPSQKIITPQNGIVFLHVLLKFIGLHGAEQSLSAIKIIYYLGFLILIYIFYNIFKQLKVSRELTFLSIGILLSSAHFFKTLNQPLNEGMWCLLITIVFYLAISNENKENYLKMAAIGLSGIILANFRLNGPIIILSISLTYLLLRNIKNSLIFFIIVIISYASVYLILAMIGTNYSGFTGFAARIYSIKFILAQPLLTVISTVPGNFLGISGRDLVYTTQEGFLPISAREMMVNLPISILLLIFYGLYLRKAYGEKNFSHLLIISFLILSLLVLQVMPGGPPRYVIMIVPFSLLAITTYFNDSKKLRLFIKIILCFTISVSIFRLAFWDTIYFNNNKSYVNIRNKMSEPYMLISAAPRYSYFIFHKGSNNIEAVNENIKVITVFGNEAYDKGIIAGLQDKFKVDHIEYLDDRIITGHGSGEIYYTVKIYTR